MYCIFNSKFFAFTARLSFYLIISAFFFFTLGLITKINVNAIAHYVPTAGELVTGTEATITSGGTSGNVGSWMGTLALDATAPGYNWTVNNDATNGLNQQLSLTNVSLSGANKMIIVIRANSNSASLNRVYQICDWVSTTNVDIAADTKCTGGGWRTLNIRKANITGTSITTYTWHIYDGYWATSTTSNTPVSTPLSNFVTTDSNRKILIRAYSTSAIAATHTIDWVRISPVIDTTLFPGGFTQITGGSVTTSYINTINGTLTGQSASDTTYLEIPGTASSISDSYLSYFNVKTYTGMNSLVLVARYDCSGTGINHKPKIYNFNTTSWENLTTTNIACSATDATSQFALNNVTLTNYISNGEIRIGWFGSANSTVAIRLDFQYIILGTTNTDSGLCEISFGTGTATNCTNTRTLDSTLGTYSTWQPTTELESTSFSHDFYGYDNDRDATSGEAAVSANLSMTITPPSNAEVVYLGYSFFFRSNSTALNVIGGLKDWSGNNATVVGGWTAAGGASANTSYTYTDVITSGYFEVTPHEYIQQATNLVNVRFRTATSTSTSNITPDIDFVMTTMTWTVEDDSIPTLQASYVPTGGQLINGTANAITSGAASGNVGSWKGTLAQDATSPGHNWNVTSTASGLDQQLFIDKVNLNGANKMTIVIRANGSNAGLTRAYQICDWVSTTNVDVAADSYCTGGGWRTLNIRKVNITSTTITNYTWHIYDGYWATSTTSNTPVSTPLSNFVSNDTNKRVLIRAYSTSTTPYVHTFDYVRINPIIDTTYFPASFTQITGGSVTTSYINTINGTLTGQSAQDTTYLDVPGTASSISDFYLSYKNIKTYTGMNTIVLVSRYDCSGTGINRTPKIYNFTTSLWENLTTSTIACSGTDATSQFALNNITISDYISSGEMRVGWVGSANSTVSIRVDFEYIILGTTNTDSNLCEISFGTGTAANCANTRNMDSTLASPSLWQPTTELESTSFSHSYYGKDNDADATSGESAAAFNTSLGITMPSNTLVNYLGYSIRFSSNSATIALIPSFKDYQGNNTTVTGGWSSFGTAAGATTYSYQDHISNNAYFSNQANDYIDKRNNLLNFRFSTNTSTSTTSTTMNIDFIMATISWIEGPAPVTSLEAFRIFNNNNSTDVGSTLAALNNPATLASTGAEFRVRTLTSVATAQLPINTEFKLQYAAKGSGSCASPSGGTPSTYTDVTTGTLIAYKDNSTPADGDALTANANDPTSSNTIKNQTYEESNNFKNSISAIPAAESGKWDFSLFDNGATSNTTYCLRIVYSNNDTLGSYGYYPEVRTATSSNTAPNSPSSLIQAKTDDTAIATGGWNNQTSVKFSATASDPNNPDTISLCVEYQPLGTSFSNTEISCGTGVAYSGTSVTVNLTISGITDAQEYHWQARVKDTGGLYSSWVVYGGNTESERDFGIDSTAPSALSVYDGSVSGNDAMFNDGSLSSVSGNWDSLNANVSGLEKYEYSIGTSAGDSSIKTWTDVGTNTSFSATSLTLQSSQMYFINVRVTDKATNTAVFSSNGQRVLPTLSFSLSSNSVTFNNLNPGNSFTDSKTTTLTTSTNAYWGYVVRLFKADSLRSVLYPTQTIGDFDGGTYANPSTWGVSNYGFGYHSSDTTIQGVDKFNPVTCPGGGSPPCYAPFSNVAPGDIVADHTTNVSGSPITAETFDITYKVKTPVTQAAGSYATTLVYTIVPQY